MFSELPEDPTARVLWKTQPRLSLPAAGGASLSSMIAAYFDITIEETKQNKTKENETKNRKKATTEAARLSMCNYN